MIGALHPGQFLRVASLQRRRISFTFDGRPVEGLEGDTLLTALLIGETHLRQSEFGDGRRAGFCLMGACQDCWLSLGGGQRVRACTTPAEDGMVVESRS